MNQSNLKEAKITVVKTAIVTGGAKRVGRAISIFLAEQGYNIAIIYNSSQAQAIEVAEEIKNNPKSIGRETFLYKCDLNDNTQINQTVSRILSEHNNVHLLVNNASIFEKFSFLSTTEDIFDRHMNINFKAPFFLTQKYAEYCKKQGFCGHVVNILDSYITTNSPIYFIYLLTKKMLAEFTEMVAREQGGVIRVNGVSIGLLLASEYWNDAQIELKAQSLPIKRQGKLAEITKTIGFLDENQYITGENIFVDGGLKLI
jgi:pteridine reductase